MSAQVSESCPCCKQPLRIAPLNGGREWSVYCGYGPCKSKASNAGADGSTQREALEKLVALVKEDPSWA